MSPSEKIVELSGNTRIAMPFYMLLAVGGSLLGMRAMGIGEIPEPDTAVIDAMNKNTAAIEAFVALYSTVPQKVHELDTRTQIHSGLIQVNTDKIGTLEDRMIDRQWRGTVDP